jgi:hypothetical protein
MDMGSNELWAFGLGLMTKAALSLMSLSFGWMGYRLFMNDKLKGGATFEANGDAIGTGGGKGAVKIGRGGPGLLFALFGMLMFAVSALRNATIETRVGTAPPRPESPLESPSPSRPEVRTATEDRPKTPPSNEVSVGPVGGTPPGDGVPVHPPDPSFPPLPVDWPAYYDFYRNITAENKDPDPDLAQVTHENPAGGSTVQ